MSGICGFVSKDTVEEKYWNDMIDKATIRGNIKNIFYDKNIGFANVTYKTNNTFFSNSKRLIISIDGKIDNKEEIKELLNTNINSDVDLIEKLYIRYEEKFVEKIEGFYAIAIYDKKEEKLILVRDKIGAKPLYYFINNNEICFASELKPIIEYPNFEKDINYKSLSLYFRFCYINPPNTIFEKTFKLEQGHILIWKNEIIKNEVYWDTIESFNILSKNKENKFEQAKENVNNILSNYIKKVIENSDNYGIFLSGGIDSSLVASIAQSISDKPVNTFSIGFFEKERNEADKSKKISQYLHTNHHEFYINKDEILNVIHKIPEYYDEPFADASEIPTIILNEFAKKNGIQIAITGDGADQLFCGSTIYDNLYLKQRFYKILNPFNIKLNFLSKSKNSRIKQIYFNNDMRNQTQGELISKDDIIKDLFKDEGEKRYNFENKIITKNWQVKRMIVDVNTFVANRINTKVDRASNFNSIDLRCPFLNNELIEYSFRLPPKFKYKNRNKKYILKEILYDYLPKELFSNKKRGFGIPISKWLNTYLYEDLMSVSNPDFIKKQNIFNYDVLYELLNKTKDKKVEKHIPQIIWNYYIFQLWYIKYIEE